MRPDPVQGTTARTRSYIFPGLETDVTPGLGRRVLVYGGGNAAKDVARTAKRLGPSETLIVYRRTREKMPAQEFEAQEAPDEGVMSQWL